MPTSPPGRIENTIASHLHPPLRPPEWLERVGRSFGYFCAALGGMAAIFWTPVTIQAQLGGMTYVWALILLFGGLLAFGATLTQRYLIEWPATYMVATGVILYLVALWGITATGSPSRLTQALLVTAYGASLLARGETLRKLANGLGKTGS